MFIQKLFLYILRTTLQTFPTTQHVRLYKLQLPEIDGSLTKVRLITHNICKHSSRFLFLLFRKLNNSAMTNDIPHTNFSELNEQPAEPLAVAEPSAQTLISHAHDSIMNPLQPEENSQMETPSPRTHENNEEPSHDLSTVRNFVYTMITLLQEFLKSSDEQGDTNRPLRIMTQTTSRRPEHNNSKETSNHHLLHELYKAIEIIAKRHQFQPHDKKSQNDHPQSTETLPKSLIQQIHNLQQQVEKLHRLPTSQEAPQRNSHRKPETRSCFHCGKYGHVAKFCRSRPLPKTLLQAKRTTHLSRQQSSIRQPNHQLLCPTGYDPSVYHPLNNWQLPPRRPRNISSPATTILPHQNNTKPTSSQTSNLEPED